LPYELNLSQTTFHP